MFLKNWLVILGLTIIGVALWAYWRQATSGVDGVTPQGGTEDAVTAIAALAGAITTLAAAISGAAMKYIEYRKASLDIEAKRLANLKAKQEINNG